MKDSVEHNTAGKIWFPNKDYHPRTVSPVRHSWGEHPLLQLPALQQLAEQLYSKGDKQVKFVAADTKAESDFKTLSEHRDGYSIQDVFERIEQPKSWIALYNVESDPRYQQLLWDILGSAGPEVAQLDPGAYMATGFIFVSTPPTTTPFHIDRENNFLLQIQGRKRITVWNPDDRDTVSEKAVEDWIANRSLEEVNFKPELMERAAFNNECTMGEGVYMPSTSAHMTNTELSSAAEDNSYSISIGVNFYTRATRRSANIYFLNSRLRKLGLSTGVPYGSALWDKLRYPFGRAMVLARRLFHGKYPPAGF